MYVYTRNSSKKHSLSPVRLINKTENILPITKQKFHNELQLAVKNGEVRLVRLIKSIQGNMWVLDDAKDITCVLGKVIDIKVPFSNLDIGYDENMEFVFVNAAAGVSDLFIPNEMLLNIKRD